MGTFQSYNTRTGQYVKHVDGRIKGASKTPFEGIPMKGELPADKPGRHEHQAKEMVAEPKPGNSQPGGSDTPTLEDDELPGEPEPQDKEDTTNESPFLFWL